MTTEMPDLVWKVAPHPRHQKPVLQTTDPEFGYVAIVDSLEKDGYISMVYDSIDACIADDEPMVTEVYALTECCLAMSDAQGSIYQLIEDIREGDDNS